ncbi:MAG TPA: glycerophosphodiester phosphodiesterase family protein [Anaerolineales bacterium]|nr:glycerophosphodiester phosphodiesterase family protein [Anaerolineales bacterium]
MAFESLPRPTIFAHRGASAYAPENTLAAFRLAVEQKADAIELDTKLTADGHVIVIHDQTLERTTNGQGIVIQTPLAALRELEAGSHFDAAFKGEKLPTLDEVFETVGRKIFINIEIANYASMTDKLPEKVTELVKKFGLTQSVMFSSFNPLALRRAHRQLPEIPLGLLTVAGKSGTWARGWLGKLLVPYQALHPEKGDATPALIQGAHKQGKRVNVYTVNLRSDLEHLFTIGIDGVFTDDPPLAQQALAGLKVPSTG